MYTSYVLIHVSKIESIVLLLVIYNTYVDKVTKRYH